jgi:hypothetical protein
MVGGASSECEAASTAIGGLSEAVTPSRLQWEAQWWIEAPRAAALLSGVWECLGRSRHAEAFRLTAALGVAAQLTGDELDRWGVSAQSQETTGDKGMRQGRCGGLSHADNDVSSAPSLAPPRWDHVSPYLTGEARLSTMSERRLMEVHRPCSHLLILLCAWLDVTLPLLRSRDRSPKEEEDPGALAPLQLHTATLLPPSIGQLLPRVTAVILAAQVRLGCMLPSTQEGPDEGPGAKVVSGGVPSEISVTELQAIFIEVGLRLRAANDALTPTAVPASKGAPAARSPNAIPGAEAEKSELREPPGSAPSPSTRSGTLLSNISPKLAWSLAAIRQQYRTVSACDASPISWRQGPMWSPVAGTPGLAPAADAVSAYQALVHWSCGFS